MDAYKSRDELLLKMGFYDYASYLQSDLWLWVRSRFYEEQKAQSGGCRCYCCAAITNLCVHHKNYALDTLVGNGNFKLTLVCLDCHRCMEFAGTEMKFPLRVANIRMEVIRNLIESGKSKYSWGLAGSVIQRKVDEWERQSPNITEGEPPG